MDRVPRPDATRRATPPTQKSQNAWLGEHGAIQRRTRRGRRQEVRDPRQRPAKSDEASTPACAADVAALAGLANIKTDVARGRPRARARRSSSAPSPARSIPPTPYAITVDRDQAHQHPPRRAVHHPHAAAGRAARASASAPSARCGPRSSSTKAWTSPARARSVSSPTCVPTRRTSRARRSRWRATTSRRQFGDKYLPEKPNFFTVSQQGCAGGPRGDPPDQPRLPAQHACATRSSPTSSGCTSSSGSASSPAR